MIQPATDEAIESRLRSLPASLTFGADDARAMGRILDLKFPVQAGSRRIVLRRRPWVRAGSAVAALATLVLINLLACYFAPIYGRALADAPGIGAPSSKILAAFGLTAGDVVLFNDSSTSSGHTLRMVAGFADGLRSVLFVSVDGKGVNDDPKGYGMNPGEYALSEYTVTDQFGHTYEGNLLSTANLISLQPLVWPASKVGARLTLHVTSLEALWLRKYNSLPGDWTLHATLVAEPAHTLPLPAAVHSPQASYTFTSIVSSTSTLSIRWKVAGPAVDEMNRLWAAGGDRTNPSVRPAPPSAQQMALEAAYFFSRLFDAAGHPVQVILWGITFTSPATGELTAFIPGPGRYRFQFGDALTADELQRWIVVHNP